MRAAICVVTFVILLLVGFLATPGLFKLVDPEYVLAMREYGGLLTKLTQESGDVDSQIASLQAKITNLRRDMTGLTIASTAAQATLAAKNATPAEMTESAIEFSTKYGSLKGESDHASSEKDMLVDKKAGIEANRTELKKKIDASAVDSVTIYLVVRALALGAIGALMSIFAKYLSVPSARSLFDDAASMGRMWASIAMGGIVSVVVIGLFFTGFISIFSNAAQNTGATDFWKVTILCLLAGAFSDRLFQAAAGRMELYLRAGERGSKTKMLATSSSARRPVQKKSKRSRTKVVSD
jgi:hypothetical protein